jgi:hypothetical protein
MQRRLIVFQMEMESEGKIFILVEAILFLLTNVCSLIEK